MIWKIILTTMLHHYPNGSTVAMSVSVVTVGQYANAETCMKYATFLAKPPELVYLNGSSVTVAKTAVCIPEEVKK